MALKTGIRVVRGPQWSHGNEDGGNDHLGTVISIPGKGPHFGKVTVVWDSVGEEKTYFAGLDNRLELRIYDIAPAGVQHKSVTCDACKTDKITGIRWKCNVCTDYDLCSPCYHADKHDKAHGFLRYVTDDCRVVVVPPRASSVRREVYGLVKGAEVVRGLHWTFGVQDGGPGKRGRIIDVGTFSGGYFRGGVRVKWDQSPDRPLGYKVGAEGKVDLVAKSKTSGGTYYPEHLPHLDVVNPHHVHLTRGDKVKVDVDLDTFRKLQKENQSGWNDGMKQCMEETGTIVTIPHPSVMRVQFEDARIWSIVRAVLTRMGTFRKGDMVQIIGSYNAAVELQVGHGGWNERMEEVLGQTGSIVDIDSDGDLRLDVKGRRWLISPVSCTVKYEKPGKDTIVQVAADEISKAQSIKNDVTQMLQMASSDSIRDYMQAADQGDLDKVKVFVAKHKDKINNPVDGKTALHMACHRGHLDIVTHLLTSGADKNAQDVHGETPLHYAVHGEQERALAELCKNGANMNAKNKMGMTPLALAVDQEELECVRILVSSGADINVQDDDGATPMHEAIRLERKEMIKILLECDKLDGSKMDNGKCNVMHKAIIGDQRKVVEVLLERNQKLAVIVGGTEDWTPLHLAAMNGRTAIAGILIKKGEGTNVNAADKSMRTPLHYAVQSCEDHIIDLLLGRDAKTSVQDKDGNTPAHLAQMAKLPSAPKKKEEEERLVQTILCMLAECGANLNLKNKQGKTPLDLCKTPELVQKLKGISDRVRGGGKTADDIPPHWTPMGDQELLVQDLLPSDALTMEEYKSVSHKFLKTMSNVEIVSIKRVQNRALWDAYNVHKKNFERKYGLGCAQELSLFHGTPAVAVNPIQLQNIDPLLAGNNVGAIWGKGAYFATDAKTSDNYAQANDDGHRFMFMARVLVGRYGQGAQGMQRPPLVGGANSMELFDSVVDNLDHPRIYVVFRNQQIYPEFLIQYE